MPYFSISSIALLIAIVLGLTGCQTLSTLEQPGQSTSNAAAPVAIEAKAEVEVGSEHEMVAKAAPIVTSSLGEPVFESPSSPPEAAQEPETREPLPQVEIPPAPPTDVWQRVRAGLKLHVPNKAKIQRELKWYASRKEYLKRVQERATPYLYFIMEEIDKRGLPADLALLPIVESAFRPFAYSPGRAAGIWQFIPSTGRVYGLKQNWWYDGRRDVMASTRAALDYLQSLNKRFDGDWELALASYNAGAGAVGRAIKKNKRIGKPTDFWSLKLPRETRSYVPRLLALSKLLAEQEKHGVKLDPIPNEPYFETVEIDSQLDLALAAEMADISIDELYLLNPGFNRWATDPKGPHRLQIPINKAEDFKQKLAALDQEKRLRWTRYKIRNGDNLGSIARRHSTTVTLLQQINKLNGTRIRAGKHLLIPVSTEKLSHYSLSAERRKIKTKNTTRKGTRLTYEVQPGDTLWDIARSYKVSHRKLASWNAMAPRDILHPGQQLSIWINSKKKGTSKTNTASLPANLNAGPAAKLNSLSYRVRKGDSLYLIAKRFNVTVADIRNWNSLPGKYLQPGQRLTLLIDPTRQAL